MSYYLLNADFSTVKTIEKAIEFSHNDNDYIVCVSISPVSQKVLTSVYMNRLPVVLHRVSVVGEPIINDFGTSDFIDVLDIDFMFGSTMEGSHIGNSVNYKDLGGKVLLYYYDRE